MDCNKIKKHLAQYIENDLKKDVSDIINKHLSSCKECSTELGFLKKYKKEMASLKELKAPADFLKQLNSRIEKRSYFSRIINAFFFPLKVKLPIEALGVVAGVILIILFFYPAEKVDNNIHFAKSEYKSKADDTADIRIAKADKLTGKMIPESEQKHKMQLPAMAQRKPMIIRDEIAATYEVALLLKKDERNASSEVKTEDTASRSAMPMEESAAPVAADKMKEYASGAGKEKDAADEPVKAGKIAEQEKALSSDAFKAKVDRKNRSAAIDNSLYQIKNFAASINGKIIAEELDKRGIQNVTVEIPAKNKKEFLSRLNGLGVLKKQNVKSDKADKSTKVKVNIQIIQEE